jgi:universal stress protein A
MYKHILLAMDLGQESQQLIERIASLQNLANSKVSIIHVIAPLPSVYGAYGIYGVGEMAIADDVVAHEKNARAALKPLAEQIGLTESDIIIKTGIESDEIIDFAIENEVDLIVAGSHGRHGLRLLLGSTANSILHSAKCDVLAVRINEK